MFTFGMQRNLVEETKAFREFPDSSNPNAILSTTQHYPGYKWLAQISWNLCNMGQRQTRSIQSESE